MAAFQLSWLIIASLLSVLPNKLHSQSDTTIFDFTTFDVKTPANLIYQGDAHTTTRSHNNVHLNQPFLRLTSADTSRPDWDPRPQRQSVGRVMYSPPVRLWDRAGRRQANFQTVFRGYIGNPNSRAIGDGIAFFVVPAVNNTIFPGSHFALYDNYTGFSNCVPVFAVELDVLVDNWDPNYRHVGINVDCRTSRSVARWDANGFGRDVEARVTYDARARLISVFANATNPPWDTLARVEHALDLKSILPEWVQIGISASTGFSAASLHDIYRWSFTSFMVPDTDIYES